MLNRSLLLSLVVVMSVFTSVNAETLDNVEFPKPPAYRVGISEHPENQYIQAEADASKPEKTYAQIDRSQDATVADMTYADLSIKQLSKEVAQDLEFDERDMVSDLSLLWQGAATQSDTINFALYKLANPDADKPDSKSLKKVLTTIASMSTLVGASIANPVLAGSSLIGGNIMNIMTQDTKALNYKYTKVNDADMIILIRKVEDLQQTAVNLYYDYMSAKKQVDLTTKLVEERERKFKLAQQNNASRELLLITDAYYRASIDKQRSAKSEFFSKRAALEQFVGNEAFVQFENELAARESGESSNNKTEEVQDNAVNEAYAETIKNVENYTNSLVNSSSEQKESAPYSYDHGNVTQKSEITDLPQLRPFVSSDEKTEQEIPINEESVTDNAKVSSDEISAVDKIAMSDEKEEKSVKPEKKKKDKYSTKGLIFIHNNEKDKAKQETTSSENNAVNDIQPVKNVTPANSNEFNFAPLDEIRIPDLDGKGYSIHSEYGDY